MKGEYRDDNNNKHPHSNPHPHPNMFSKFIHQQQPQQTPQQQQQSQHHFAHQFQLSNTSEEADSPSNVISPNVGVKKDANDGASIEVVKRPRGRPPGSKNKPKPPVIITREPDPAMAPYVLELPGGTDIVDTVKKYCEKRNTGLCILTGSGTVANVSLRQPTTTTAGGTVTFHGRFDILSISATVFPSGPANVAAFANAATFTISLAGPQGQIVGGVVAGPLVSAGPVYIIAASFNNPMYHRLPSEDENSGGSVDATDRSPPPAGTRTGSGSAGGGEHQHHSQPPSTTAADTMSMYSSHLPSDVIWAPTARQPY